MSRILAFRIVIPYAARCSATSRFLSSSTDTSVCFKIPKPKMRNETFAQMKARLLYQSRKRGMLENGLLFSTFADKYLNTLTPELINQYDKLINEPSNDWDIYYWLTGKEEPPAEFKNEIFNMMQKHTLNKELERRYRQPDLQFE